MHGGTHLPPTTAPKSKRCAAGRAFLLHSPHFFVINLHHTALLSLELTLPFQFVLDEANITTAAKLCCRHERGANFSSCSARLVAFETIFSKRYLSGWIFFVSHLYVYCFLFFRFPSHLYKWLKWLFKTTSKAKGLRLRYSNAGRGLTGSKEWKVFGYMVLDIFLFLLHCLLVVCTRQDTRVSSLSFIFLSFPFKRYSTMAWEYK